MRLEVVLMLSAVQHCHAEGRHYFITFNVTFIICLSVIVWGGGLTNAKEIYLPNYLPIGGGRIIGFPPFLKVLMLYEILLASSRI